jgi:GTP-binding protein
VLTPAKILSLEESLSFIAEDELLEVTPLHLRLRKKILDKGERAKHADKN